MSDLGFFPPLHHYLKAENVHFSPRHRLFFRVHPLSVEISNIDHSFYLEKLKLPNGIILEYLIVWYLSNI